MRQANGRSNLRIPNPVAAYGPRPRRLVTRQSVGRRHLRPAHAAEKIPDALRLRELAASAKAMARRKCTLLYFARSYRYAPNKRKKQPPWPNRVWRQPLQ